MLQEGTAVMPGIHLEINPVSHITCDAIGKPGERIFYLVGFQAEHTICLLLEKVQIQSLAVAVEQFFSELSTRFPELPAASDVFDEEKMHVYPPLDPLFRIGEVGLEYNPDSDQVTLSTREILTDQFTSEEASTVRFFCTRSQLNTMCRWGLEIASRGRSICPQCGEPMDPAGHFCPKKNGHKH
jgi:uncharacterized repeat protein (TIGR03847 family)